MSPIPAKLQLRGSPVESGRLVVNLDKTPQDAAQIPTVSKFFPLIGAAVRHAINNPENIKSANSRDLIVLQDLSGKKLGELKEVFLDKSIKDGVWVRDKTPYSSFALMLSREERVAVAKALETYKTHMQSRLTQNSDAIDSDSRQSLNASLISSELMAKNLWDSVSLRRTPRIWYKLMLMGLNRMLKEIEREYPDYESKPELDLSTVK